MSQHAAIPAHELDQRFEFDLSVHNYTQSPKTMRGKRDVKRLLIHFLALRGYKNCVGLSRRGCCIEGAREYSGRVTMLSRERVITEGIFWLPRNAALRVRTHAPRLPPTFQVSLNGIVIKPDCRPSH